MHSFSARRRVTPYFSTLPIPLHICGIQSVYFRSDVKDVLTRFAGDRSSDRGSGSDSGNLDFLVFFIPGMDTGLNTGFCTGSRSTTDHSEREIRCCAYFDYRSCLDLCGEEESGAFIFRGFSLLRRTSPPHPLAPI
jgi:hypothetical protein